MQFPTGKVFISTQALERIRKDRRVQQNLKKYVNIIRILMEVGKQYQTETIGEFFVSPRGRSDVRVAWYQEGDALIIYDFLYEVRTGIYVEDWNEKAKFGKITRKGYRIQPLTQADVLRQAFQ